MRLRAVGQQTPLSTFMTEYDARRIIDWLDSALELFRANGGRLTVREVRILSMLSVARQELNDEVSSRRDRAPGGAEPRDQG